MIFLLFLTKITSKWSYLSREISPSKKKFLRAFLVTLWLINFYGVSVRRTRRKFCRISARFFSSVAPVLKATRKFFGWIQSQFLTPGSLQELFSPKDKSFSTLEMSGLTPVNKKQGSVLHSCRTERKVEARRPRFGQNKRAKYCAHKICLHRSNKSEVESTEAQK